MSKVEVSPVSLSKALQASRELQLSRHTLVNVIRARSTTLEALPKRKSNPLGAGTQNVSFNMTTPEVQLLKQAAAEQLRSVSQIIRAGIKRELEEPSTPYPSDSRTRSELTNLIEAAVNAALKDVVMGKGKGRQNIIRKTVELISAGKSSEWVDLKF